MDYERFDVYGVCLDERDIGPKIKSGELCILKDLIEKEFGDFDVFWKKRFAGHETNLSYFLEEFSSSKTSNDFMQDSKSLVKWRDLVAYEEDGYCFYGYEFTGGCKPNKKTREAVDKKLAILFGVGCKTDVWEGVWLNG